MPQRLARLGRARRHRPAARSRPRARRRGRRRGRGRRTLEGRRPGHRSVRVRMRPVHVVPPRRRAGVPRPAAAGVHPLGVVRRTGGPARRGHESRRDPRRRVLRGRRRARVPLRHRLPGPHGTCAPVRRGMGHDRRRRRSGSECRDDRQGARRAGRRGRPQRTRAADRRATGRRPRRAGRRRCAGAHSVVDRRRKPRVDGCRRVGADLRRCRAVAAPVRSPRAGRTAAEPHGSVTDADGARDRVGTRRARQPRHGRRRLSGDAVAHRERRSASAGPRRSGRLAR